MGWLVIEAEWKPGAVMDNGSCQHTTSPKSAANAS